MKQAAKPSGQSKTATKDSILASELERLQEARARLKDGNARYIERHPELRTLMDEFIAATIAQKPSDIIKFGAKWFASLREGQKGHAPLIITGPSGVGCTTIYNMLMKKYRKVFAKPLETTTRAPKDYETHGEDFYFVSEFEFQSMIERKEFISWNPVYENFYGITLDSVEKVIESGKIALLDLPVDKLEPYRKCPLEIKYLFLTPPSVDALEDRLIACQRYNPSTIDDKVEKAPELIEMGMNDPGFDANINNDELQTAFQEVVYQLIGWYQNADIDPPEAIVPTEADAKSAVSNKSGKSAKSKDTKDTKDTNKKSNDSSSAAGSKKS
jgi:guanylate kinase